MRYAYFGGGCFWCTEAIFAKLKGVKTVIPGYAGGKKENPSYEDVATGETGHAEVIKIEFDPKIITYDELLDIFFHVHDPTTVNRQDYDVGTMYRSVILYINEEQKQKAYKAKEFLEKSKEYKSPIVTKIEELAKFYDAEEYHRNFYEKNPQSPYCQLVIEPKIKKFLEKYSNKVK